MYLKAVFSERWYQMAGSFAVRRLMVELNAEFIPGPCYVALCAHRTTIGDRATTRSFPAPRRQRYTKGKRPSSGLAGLEPWEDRGRNNCKGIASSAGRSNSQGQTIKPVALLRPAKDPIRKRPRRPRSRIVRPFEASAGLVRRSTRSRPEAAGVHRRDRREQQDGSASWASPAPSAP